MMSRKRVSAGEVTRKVAVTLTPTNLERLDEMAKIEGSNRSAFVRMLIDQAWARWYLSASAKRRVKITKEHS